MLNEIKLRLSSFGYTMLPEDEPLLDYLSKKLVETVKNLTNLDEVPEGLHYKIVDGVCAEFLESKFSTGKLDNISNIVKSIQEGDTTINFSENSTPEAKFLSCIEAMRFNPNYTAKYRKLVW